MSPDALFPSYGDPPPASARLKEDVADYEIRMRDGEFIKVKQGVFLFDDARLTLVKPRPGPSNALLFSAPWTEVQRIRRIHDDATKLKSAGATA